MRKILALGFLIALAALLWYAGRWFAADEALEATLVFSAPVAVRPGNSVVHDGVSIGHVESVSTIDTDRKAVTVEISPEFRHLLRTDSTYRIDHRDDAAVVTVSSRLAVGPPVSDRAIIPVESSELAKWVARGTEAVRPLSKKVSESAAGVVDWYESGNFDRSLQQWKSSVPEWKQQGSEVFDRNLTQIRERVDATEESLRKARKDVEADELRKKFDTWLRSIKE